ncbi:MAG TPA: hypothetical protein VLA56_15460, partial [Pseudomonadales bacterium]|nr:hypothetical protein [Pseudomonadales bacterium]
VDQRFSGDTTAAPNRVETYACDAPVRHDGPEDIWELVIDQPGQVAVVQRGGTAITDTFLLSACNEGACVAELGAGGCAPPVDRVSGVGGVLPPGTYYLVVETPLGGEGDYELELVWEPPFDNWRACEIPQAPTVLETEVASSWNLSDAAFCTAVCADGTSCNIDPACPDGSTCLPNPNSTAVGCSFAMYVAVPCGTSFHIPFFDTEGGHVRIYDIFGGAYVDLTALSGGGWFQMGDEIIWQDADCVTGSDPRWNETVTDVSFERPQGICGLFRLEFIEHSGNVWQLYANCTGDAMAQFNIYDSLCGALASYDPLPNVSIVSASATTDCPDIHVSYTLRNDGCRDAVDFPLVLMDDLTVVSTEIV